MSRWLPFVLLTVLSWGTYIPTLHKGQLALNGSGVHAFMMVGVAYLLVAIAIPGVIITRAGSWAAFTPTGMGFTLAAGTAVLYLHPTGGRPIITFPPFLIITYELTILIGILATVIGFLISARFPAIRERAYAPESAVDKFTVSVACARRDELERAAAILREAGALEVREISSEETQR